MRITVAISALLAAGAIALLAAGFAGSDDLAALLASRAPDGQVSAAYVDAVQFRARACGAGALIVATLAFALGRCPRPSSIGFRTPAIVLVLIAIGAAARFALLAKPLHYDEAFTFTEYASQSPLFFLTRYTHPNNHVLHTLLAWLMPGESLPLLRLPAFVAGIAVIWLTWRVAEELHDGATAAVACALAAGAMPLVAYSAEGRGYTLVACFALLLYLAARDLDGRWPIAAAALALGAWTVPVMMFAAAAWGAWVVATVRPIPWRALVATAIASAAATFVLYVPILVVSGPASITENGNVLPVPLAVLARELPGTLADAWRQWHLSFTPAGMLAAVALAVAGIARQRGRDAFLIGTLAALALTIAVRRVPFARVWIFLLPLYLIAVAHGLTLMTRRRGTAWIALAIAAVTALNAVRLASRLEFFEDAALLDGPAIARLAPRDGQVLITTPLDAPLRWYLRDRDDVVVYRFDSDPAAVRAAFTAPKRYVLASRHARGLDAYRQLGIRGSLVPVHVLDHAAVYEIR